MLFLKNFLSALFLALFFCGCNTPHPPRLSSREYTPEKQAVIAKRTAELSLLLQPLPVRAALLDLEEISEADLTAPTTLFLRVAALGFNRTLLLIRNEDFVASSKFRSFSVAARAAKVEFYPFFRQSDFVTHPAGNVIQRRLVPTAPNLEEVVRLTLRRNRSLSEEEQISGIAIAVAPHLFDDANLFRPKDWLYAWGPNRFGPGLDNEMMMRKTLDELRRITAETAPLPLLIQIPDFYQELVREKKLETGAVTDFLNLPRHPSVLLEDQGNKPSELVKAVSDEFAATPATAKGRLLVAVRLAGHTAVTTGALRRRDWNDFLRSLGYAVSQFQKSPAFGGIVVGPFSIIETLQQED